MVIIWYEGSDGILSSKSKLACKHNVYSASSNESAVMGLGYPNDHVYYIIVWVFFFYNVVFTYLALDTLIIIDFYLIFVLDSCVPQSLHWLL